MRLILALVAFWPAARARARPVPGQSTVADVEAKMGAPAEKHEHSGETVYYYPQLPWACHLRRAHRRRWPPDAVEHG